MSQQAFALLLGLAAILGALVGALVFSLLRIASATTDAHRGATGARSETAFMTTAIEEAVGRLRQQERVLTDRAEASERLNAEIVASLASGLMLVEVGNIVRLINPAGRRLLGLPEDAAVGALRDVLEGAIPLAAIIEESLGSGVPVVRRTVALGPDSSLPGGIAHLGVTVTPVAGAGRSAPAVICLFSDLTSIVALEEQLRLKDGLARLGELTAGLAHEFRNGLATIHGYAHMLDPSSLASAQAACVAGIRQETEALGQIVTNFLNFARPVQLSGGLVDLGAVVERAAEECRAEAERQAGTVTIRGTFPAVEGDEPMLRQVFSNLCRNALEATARAQRPAEVVIEGRLDPAYGMVVVTVSDNGPGIEPGALSRLFQPFFTTRPQGTGLGLALVQKIVVTHNGRVSAANRQQGGATFEVRLPSAPRATTEASVP
jgi:signal transduction histidine kinase